MPGAIRKLSFAAAFVSAAAVLCAVFSPAEGAARTCRQLRAEIAAASGGTRNGGIVAKYDDAIHRQRAEIDKARRQASYAGCGFSIFGANVTQCAGLNAAIDRMGRNLDSLQRKRTRLGGGGSRTSTARLQAMLDAKGCNGTQAKAAPGRTDTGRIDTSHPNLLQMLFGGGQHTDPSDATPDTARQEQVVGRDQEETAPGRRIERVLTPQNGRIVIQNGLPSGNGDYRTLCVRTCDGYFFPMSNAASVGDFERDQKNCESSCPGTDIQLFYTRGLDAETASMVSVATGRPYSDLPSAFLYKQPNMSVPKSCGCNAVRTVDTQRNFKVIAGESPLPAQDGPQARDGASSFTPVPGLKPDAAADPETTANADGGLDLDAIRNLASKPPPAGDDVPPEQRKVRVVGPTFLPDPKAAIDLRVQDRKAIR